MPPPRKAFFATPEPISVPTCRGCETAFDVEDLDRHERDGLVLVHCPDCGFRMGTWRDPAVRPVRDRR